MRVHSLLEHWTTPSARALGGMLLAVAMVASLSGCEGEAQSSQAYPVRVLVQSDPGKAVAGATVQKNGRDVGTADVAGAATVNLAGREGDTVDLTVKCPEGYQSPTKPIAVRLTRRGDTSKIPEYSATCAPTFRNVVVAVRAESGPLLPVTYLGKPIARTDESGAAHVLLRMRPGDQFELGLDTTSVPKHHPQNPKASFLVPAGSDDIQRFDVRFEVEKPKVFVRRAPTGPRRI